MAVMTLDPTLPETLTGAGLKKELSKGNAKKVLVVDSDTSIHIFYKSSLEQIVGSGNVTLVSGISEAYSALKTSFYSAYVIEPYMQAAGRNDWGFEVVDYIRRKEGNYDSVWILSAEHNLLKDGEAKGIKHFYTKKDQREADGYKTKEDFLNDIRLELSGGGGTASETD